MNAKPIVYNLYLDESGRLFRKNSNEKRDFFVVGGYLIKDFNLDNWSDRTKKAFDMFKKDFPSIPANKIIHRTECKRDYSFECAKITKALFKNIMMANEKNGFLYIYEDKPDSINSTEYYYINLVSILVIKTLLKLVSENQKSSVVLNVICALRKDQNTNNHIKYQEIESAIIDKVNELKLKYGVTNTNCIFKLENAKEYYPLVFADYVCNSIYEARNMDIKKHLSTFGISSDRILNDIRYTAFDLEFDIYLSRKDYYNIINKFIFYKKLLKSNNNKYKKFAKSYIERIDYYLKDEKSKKKDRYIKEALKSILENIEYESNAYRDFNNIIDTYNILLEFCDLSYNHSNNNYDKIFCDYLKFLINVDRLATYNHKDDSENTTSLSKEIDNYIRYFNENDIDHAGIDIVEERFITYYNISSIMYWHLYDVESSINSLEDFINHNEDMPDSKLVPLYGTLGQSYIINYYVTEDSNNLKLSKDMFDIALSKSSDSKLHKGRTYSNFMLLYIVSNSSKEFEETLLSYIKLDNIDDLGVYIKGLTKDDKNDVYLVKRLLSFCNYTIKNEIRDRISSILLENRNIISNFLQNITDIELVDIARDYSLFCFYNGVDFKSDYLDHSISFMFNISGYMNEMRLSSLYAVKVIMGDLSYYDNMLKIVDKLSSTTEGYKKTFEFISSFNTDSLESKKDLAFKIITKLYM